MRVARDAAAQQVTAHDLDDLKKNVPNVSALLPAPGLQLPPFKYDAVGFLLPFVGACYVSLAGCSFLCGFMQTLMWLWNKIDVLLGLSFVSSLLEHTTLSHAGKTPQLGVVPLVVVPMLSLHTCQCNFSETVEMTGA